MVSKSTSILLAVAVVAVSAVAIIGLGYAYTAATENTGNTSIAKYITLDQGAAGNYTGAFDDSINYNTENTSTGTTYLIDGLAERWNGGTPMICLGTATITVNNNTGNTDGFKFSVTDGGTMTGTFYIGIKVGSGDEFIREYTPGSANYYATANTHSAVAAATNAAAPEAATTIDGSAVAQTIVVKMYMSALGSSTTAPDSTKPLNNVTFTFKATSVAAA